MAERHRLILGELADMSLSLARRLHEEAMAADPAQAEGLVLAFQRVSRSLRQTLALEARLERERTRAIIEAARLAEEERRTRRSDRRGQVKAVLSQLIWTEAERWETSDLLAELERRVEAHCLDEAFIAAPVEAVIARLRAELGFPANDEGRDEEGGDEERGEEVDDGGPGPEPGRPGLDWRSG